MNNYLHLDLKGIIPTYPRILQWLEFLARCGFSGIVWEYEDRYPWQSWPSTFRPGYTREQWQTIRTACRDLKLDVVPLVQTQGHLEWLLKFDQYAAWRENGCWNEICPGNKDAVRAILNWLDEVMALHPDTEYIHIGGDETWNLASCTNCAKAANLAENGKLQLYLDHINRIANHVIAKGFRPMIWGDMFWREERPELAAELPDKTILIDWQYRGRGPWETTAQLAATGREIWGASATSAGFDLTRNVLPINDRIGNIQGWLSQQPSISGIIHTTWSRSRSLMPLYGPWHNAIPGFLAAGTNDLWATSELEPYVHDLDNVIHGSCEHRQSLIDQLLKAQFADRYADETRRWWILLLRYLALRDEAVQRGMNFSLLEASDRFLKAEPDMINHCRQGNDVLCDKLGTWCENVKAFFEASGLSDADEFIFGRRNALLNLLKVDWAEESVAKRKPVSSR